MNYSITFIRLVLLLGAFGAPVRASQAMTTNQNENAESWYVPVSREDLLALTDNDPQVRKVAQMIIERAYEQAPRTLFNSQGYDLYGFAFPLYPEVIVQLMKSVKGKTVLEVGAGYGENALLLALAGAQRVYINDIMEENFIPLMRDMKALPQSYRDSIHMLKGDCFDLIKNPELNQSCDLIIARNIMHFFTSEKRDQFFKMIAFLLKPGGQLIVSLNAPFGVIPHEQINRYPDVSLFYRITPVLSIPGQPVQPIDQMAEFPVPRTTNVDPLEFTHAPLVSFTSKGIEKQPSLKLFSEDTQKEILQYVQNIINAYGTVLLGRANASIICHKGYVLCYTVRTLPSLLNTTSLKLIQALYTDFAGHTTKVTDGLPAVAPGLTVVLKKETEKACFTCGKNATQLCSRCKRMYFCDRECQVAGWKQHKKECTSNQ